MALAKSVGFIIRRIVIIVVLVNISCMLIYSGLYIWNVVFPPCQMMNEKSLMSSDGLSKIVLRNNDCCCGFGLGFWGDSNIILETKYNNNGSELVQVITLYTFRIFKSRLSIQIKWEDNHTPVVVIPNAMGDILVNYRVFKYGLYRPKLIFEPDDSAARLVWFQQSKLKLNARMIRNYNLERLNIPPDDLVSSNPCVLCWDHTDIDAVGDP